jgi:hypothetical protein
MYLGVCQECIPYTITQGKNIKRMYLDIQGCILHPKDVYFGGLVWEQKVYPFYRGCKNFSI